MIKAYVLFIMVIGGLQVVLGTYSFHSASDYTDIIRGSISIIGGLLGMMSGVIAERGLKEVK